MAESPFAVMSEFKELFEELGELSSNVFLRMVIRPDVNGEGAETEDLPLGDETYGPLVDDPRDRDTYQISALDRRLFRIWGGAFDEQAQFIADLFGLDVPTQEEIDDDEVNGENLQAQRFRLVSTTAMNAALKPGGGIVYDGVLHPLAINDTAYFRGFSVNGVASIWYAVTEVEIAQR